MVVRWIFTDPTDSSSYTFEINPNEGGSPTLKKNVLFKNTAAPNGKTLIYEGRDDPVTFSFSGTLLTQAQLEAFETWYLKRHQIVITDDLGRTFSVYITSFDPKRVRSAHIPWKHTYTVEAISLDWPLVDIGGDGNLSGLDGGVL